MPLKKINLLFILYIFIWYSFANTQINIFLEGLGGSGKTTLSKILIKNLHDTEIIFEPLEKWFDIDGKGNLFDLFIKNIQRWSFTTQVYIPFARASTIKEKIYNSNKFRRPKGRGF